MTPNYVLTNQSWTNVDPDLEKTKATHGIVGVRRRDEFGPPGRIKPSIIDEEEESLYVMRNPCPLMVGRYGTVGLKDILNNYAFKNKSDDQG